ncbi:hypothetical protein HK096_011606 [Nowakowskiella sp. JEL0078]|nr:hypothetical protein HK096_011606 [Nowakowskiella sp. JEL0078]
MLKLFKAIKNEILRTVSIDDERESAKSLKSSLLKHDTIFLGWIAKMSTVSWSWKELARNLMSYWILSLEEDELLELSDERVKFLFQASECLQLVLDEMKTGILTTKDKKQSSNALRLVCSLFPKIMNVQNLPSKEQILLILRSIDQCVSHASFFDSSKCTIG